MSLSSCNQRQEYCGTVVNKGFHPAGYKVQGKYFIVLKLKKGYSNHLVYKAIENVDPDSYYNLVIGGYACFEDWKEDAI